MFPEQYKHAANRKVGHAFGLVADKRTKMQADDAVIRGARFFFKLLVMPKCARHRERKSNDIRVKKKRCVVNLNSMLRIHMTTKAAIREVA